MDGEEELTCQMCKNPEYTWYEVMRNTCGLTTKEMLDTLCKSHQIVLANQLEEVAGKSIGTKAILE